jgi:hypothetical protein
VNILLFCQQQYLLTPNTKDRQNWIASKLQAIEANNSKATKHSYFIGSGTVISTIPERDAVTKEKFRLTEVLFVKKEEQTEYKHVFEFSASSIQMFYPTMANPVPALEFFLPARFE